MNCHPVAPFEQRLGIRNDGRNAVGGRKADQEEGTAWMKAQRAQMGLESTALHWAQGEPQEEEDIPGTWNSLGYHCRDQVGLFPDTTQSFSLLGPEANETPTGGGDNVSSKLRTPGSAHIEGQVAGVPCSDHGPHRECSHTSTGHENTSPSHQKEPWLAATGTSKRQMVVLDTMCGPWGELCE
uniref:uncharacterized protein LOC120889525 isoform X2 n=1 Tax=Ictidomys tridecemlineatus TaxID=43179 RepID=UPI001A9D0626|nr:uncharacterized protein LOC120889525 isoform X2 [Ictidomys tridecemlineatus]